MIYIIRLYLCPVIVYIEFFIYTNYTYHSANITHGIKLFRGWYKGERVDILPSWRRPIRKHSFLLYPFSGKASKQSFKILPNFTRSGLPFDFFFGFYFNQIQMMFFYFYNFYLAFFRWYPPTFYCLHDRLVLIFCTWMRLVHD